MSSVSELKINDTALTPLKDAAKQFSYSKDYVARLAREKKIVATQIGRQWFIDTVSLKNFAEVADLERELRKKYLSEERKAEQHVKEKVSVLASEEHRKAKVRTARHNAQVLAGAVLSLGLVVGSTLYVQLMLSATTAPPANALLSIGAQNSVQAPNDNSLPFVNEQPLAVSGEIMTKPIFSKTEEQRTLDNKNVAGIFLLSSDGATTTAESIAAQFADPVSVHFTDVHTGVVIYQLPDGTTSEYPFLLVPEVNSPAG